MSQMPCVGSYSMRPLHLPRAPNGEHSVRSTVHTSSFDFFCDPGKCRKGRRSQDTLRAISSIQVYNPSMLHSCCTVRFQTSDPYSLTLSTVATKNWRFIWLARFDFQTFFKLCKAFQALALLIPASRFVDTTHAPR